MKPWQSREEMLVDLAMESALTGTPPMQNRELFPKRRGFVASQPTIYEVMGVGRSNPTFRSWMSGMPVRPSVMSDQSWSGTSRNAMSEGVW